jgi:acetolactate synthase-1/2/3 large subunit
MDPTVDDRDRSTAERLLERMKALGVDYIFGNAGTDFPAIIEAFARRPKTGFELPEPVLAAHETVAVGMAHGYWLGTGRAQCAMVHVNVGLANATMGLLNAAADNVPLLMCSGRTPVTERGRFGSRSRPIHWGQEMRDQAAMVREAVKWDYELRYPEQGALIIERALAIAASDPAGPVYLSLPREVLAEAAPSPSPLEPRQEPVRAGGPRPEAVAQAVDLIRAAAHPVIIAQRPPARASWDALEALADRFAIPVVEFWATRNVLSTEHPMHAGGDPAAWLAEADVVITLEAMVPWLIDQTNSGWEAKVIAIGVDPLFQRVPVRSFPVDVALAGDPALAVTAVCEGLSGLTAAENAAVAQRREAVTRLHVERREAARRLAERGAGAPMSVAYVSHCLSEAKGQSAAVFNELGCDSAVMRFTEPNTYFSAALSGGLGWALPAALGFQLADRERLVLACVGDGSYIFANPTACHLAAVAHKLPVLIVVFNNGVWQAVRRATLAMYPDGDAAKSNAMPFTQLSPSPDYAALSRAHGCFGEKVEDGAVLPDAIGRALKALRDERLPALLDIHVAPS